jgi:hypothetical protein
MVTFDLLAIGQYFLLKGGGNLISRSLDMPVGALYNVVLYAFAERNRRQIADRILPIFGSVSNPLRVLVALFLVVVLILPVITSTHLLFRMQAPDMGIVALHDENRYHLSGNEIFDFKNAYDWRWRDPQDASGRLTAFPGWQP